MPSNGLTSLLWFIGIVVMIPVALWLFRRTPAGALFSGTGGAGAMRHISALPLSANQRLVTVEVGQGEARRWLVLGVTAQSITTLHTLDAQGDAPMIAAPAMPAFAQLLARLRQDKGAPGER